MVHRHAMVIKSSLVYNEISSHTNFGSLNRAMIHTGILDIIVEMIHSA